MILKSVVFPVPLSPISPTRSPRSMRKFRPRKMTRSPKDFSMLASVTIGTSLNPQPLLCLFHLRHRLLQDVGVRGIVAHEILVVILGLEKLFQGFERRDDRTRENFRLVELLDIRRGDALLLIIPVKDCRAILPSGIGALTIQRRRVVCN